MVSANTKAMGIIFPNSYDSLVPEMVNLRLMASLPFASRYRLIDFVLSSMSHCGIDNIAILPNQHYLSLMDHIGTGREWDLARRKGGVRIYPPYAEQGSTVFDGRIGALANISRLLNHKTEKYVVMADANIAMNFDFNAMIAAHIQSGADITIAYNEQAIPAALQNPYAASKDPCYAFKLEGDKIKDIYVNPGEGVYQLSMNIFVMERQLLIDLVKDAFSHGHIHFIRDVLMAGKDKLDIRGYQYTGYVARILGMCSYFDENMKLLDNQNLDSLFEPAPIYTKVRDDDPTRYAIGAVAKNVMAADGCVIEGEVENSILFRGVKIKKGAKVKNCILMQDTTIESGADIEYVISDKLVTVSEGKKLMGSDSHPMYIPKGNTV